MERGMAQARGLPGVLCAALVLVVGGCVDQGVVPATLDVLKCQLKPIDPADYAMTLTAEEMRRLEAMFSGGVCDWSKPGVGQVPNTRTWLSYGPSPVNRYE